MSFLSDIWKNQPPGYFAVSSKTGDNWQDYFFRDFSEVEDWIKKHRDESDLYFCTTTLKKPKRTKDNVQSSMFLWQDLDEVNPATLPKGLMPTIAWQSSPNRYQALWKLDELRKPKEIENLNKALAKTVHADKGSWILTKVLRIPGTMNFKYENKPVVQKLWSSGPEFTYRALARQLGLKDSSQKDNLQANSGNFKRVLQRNWSKIPTKVRNLLLEDHVTVGKRSDILWYLEHELVKAGLGVPEVYTLIKNSAWNKFKGRRDEETRLSEELSKAFSDEIIGLEKEPENDDDSDNNLTQLVLENDLDLMGGMSYYPGWLVEGFWTRKSHGIVAGEPKSFKSTLVMDLIVSIASGKDFLNKFPVVERGPVLIVQNENARWIMKDRLNKIRCDRGLIGEVDYDKNSDTYRIKFPRPLPIYYINQQGFNFSNPLHKKILIKIIKKVKPKLIVFDPLYLMFDGDINLSKDLNPVLNWLLSLKNRFECSLILVHHWKKNANGVTRGGQRMLGSTILHGWVESAWYLEVKGAPENIEASSDSEILNSPTGRVKIVLEREFRGAGIYPKVDLEINMGNFGSSDYKVTVEQHKKEVGRAVELDKVQVEKDVRNYLELHKDRAHISVRELSREIGISKNTADEILKKIYDSNQTKNNKKRAK